MIQIKPLEDGNVVCEPGHRLVPADYVLWQGIHVCAVTRRDGGGHLVRDLPVGHAAFSPFTVDLEKREVDGKDEVTAWLWRPFLNSLLNPDPAPVAFSREVLHERKQAIIINCLEWMYGHCLGKLLYAEQYIREYPDHAIIVLIPAFLRWLVPEGVAEIWTAKLSLKQMPGFYPDLHRQITAECARFDRILLAEVCDFPRGFDIQNFTRVQPHQFTGEARVVTFIWREDRPWVSGLSWRFLRKLRSRRLLLESQNRRIRRFFDQVRKVEPKVTCCVAGLGRSTTFPDRIEDLRVDSFTDETERRIARRYAESRVVIGVHGANMLLPSALAGATIDLMPIGKWDCLPLDVLPNETDPLMALFRYRFVPVDTDPDTLVQITLPLLNRYHDFRKLFNDDGASH
jgi:hypothetical protein